MGKPVKILRVGKYVGFSVLFSIALSGCSLFKKEQPVDPNAMNIVVWSFEDEDTWKPIIKDFESRSGGFKLIYKKETLDAGYETRALNSILSGEGPDVWAMPNDWVYRHQAKLQPLVPGILAEFDVNKYIPAVQQSIVINDQVYALSPSAEPLMVYYNPKLFEAATERVNKAYEGREEENKEVIEKAHRLLSEPPKTWTEFTETVKLLTTKNGGNVETAGVAMGTEKIAHSADILYLLMMQNETSIISDDMKLATFNLPRQTAVGQEDYSGKRALELYTSFANQSSPNYSWNDALGNEVDAFANGKVAMIFGYSNIQNYLLQKYPNLPFQYRKTFVPQVGQDNDSIVDYARFTAFGVPNISRNPVMAWKLLNIIANDHADVLNAANRTYTSHAAEELKVTMEERVAGDPEKLSLVKAKSLVKGRFPIEFDNQFRYAIYLVNRGSQDPKSALDLASINITKLLTRTEW